MNLQIEKIFNDSTKLPIGVGVVSFVVGVGVGLGVNYIRDRRKYVIEPFSNKLPSITKHNIDDVKEFVASERERLIQTADDAVQNGSETGKPEETTGPIEDVTQPDHPVDVGRQFIEKKLEEPVVITPQAEEIESEPIARSIFAGTDSEWDYEKELQTRTSSEPYVLHKDEFYANELDYVQVTLTYYNGDDILVDEDDTPVYNYHQVVGQTKFGHGSGDPNVVYVRNDKRKAEYEILFDPGMYSKEVLGLDIERNTRANDLRHSNHVPRFHME